MKTSVLRSFARRASGPAVSPFFAGLAAALLCGLMSFFTACFSGSDPEIPEVTIVKRIPEITESITIKISPAITGLADGRILAAWGSHVPESGKAWKTDWKMFDEQGEPLGQGFDWVSYPGRVMKTISASGTTDGAVIASIVEFSPGRASEIYVREFRNGGSQIDPGVISIPGARLIVDIALLALDKSDLVLATMGSSENGPAIWIGRFDRT